MKIFGAIFLLIFSCSMHVSAQNLCEAEAKFNGIQCVQRAGGEKCVNIAVVGDLQGMDFNYQWELGDGTFKNGAEIEHCYAEFDVYTVKLHLIDPTTGFRFEDELVETINIEDSGSPEILTDKEVNLNSNVTFDYRLLSDEFLVSEVYWSIGDELFSCDKKPTYHFDEITLIEVNVLLVGLKNGVPLQICTSKSYDVREFILDGKQLNDVFTEKEQTLTDRGRFLNDEVHYILYEKDNPSKFQLLDIRQDKYNVDVEVDKEYEMYAWKGNLFTPIQPLSTIGLTKNQAENTLKDAIQMLFSKEPVHIEGFRFGLDESEPPSDAVSKVAQLMLQYAHVNIGIGVYTHTGGRMNKNLELSKLRGENIKRALQQQGIDAKRLTVLTAREEHDLLNTCYGVINCDLEDENLNRRVEFKVEGITKNIAL